MSRSLKASFSGSTNNFKKKNHYKLKDGDTVFRIVPPMTKFTDNPRGWIRYHSVHFGYKNSEGKLRMFESPLEMDFTTKTVLVADPALDRVNELKDKLEKAKLEGNAPLTAKLEALVGYSGNYNVDNNFHLNVIGLDGSIGELKIRKTAKVALEAEIKRLESEGVHALSEEDGRFFIFHREGSGRNTTFKVSVYTEKLDIPNVGKVDKQVSHKITSEMWDRLESEAFDLDDLFFRATSEEVAQIVAESDLLTGKSPAIDRIIDASWKAKRDANNSDGPSDPVPFGDVPTPSPVITQAKPVSPVVTPKTTTVAPKAVATPQVAAAPTQAQSIEELSDDDFFKQIGAV